MLRKLLVSTCLTFCVAACAHSPSMAATAHPAEGAPTKLPPAGCVADTATRIPVSPSECAAFGRVWTDQDVKSTGATDAAHALHQLDPSVTVSGH